MNKYGLMELDAQLAESIQELQAAGVDVTAGAPANIRAEVGRFSNEEANDFYQTSQVLTDGLPNFVDQNKQISAEAFLPKYMASVFIPEEDKANSQNTLNYIQQDANSNLANNNGYAGSEGVKPT